MFHNYITHSTYIAMYYTIYKCLSYGIMCRCLFLSYTILNHKWPWK